MQRAYSLIRKDPVYRHEAFLSGLKVAGYEVVDKQPPDDIKAGDVLVIWNRYGDSEYRANRFEASGGIVLVAENGYIGKDKNGIQPYAISVHGHNGSGWYPVGDTDRYSALDITPEPWKTSGDYVLVCGQRGIGTKEMRSPDNWHDKAAAQLSALAKKVKLRLHPGTYGIKLDQHPLEEQLDASLACAIWSSSSGVKALIRGIPVIYDAPHWICEGAAVKGMAGVNDLIRDDEARMAALQKMAWGQWFVDEIQSGAPFKFIRERIAEAKW